LKTVNFLTNASSAVGLGHITRCMHLAEKFFAEGFAIKFFTPNTCEFRVSERYQQVIMGASVWNSENDLLIFFKDNLKDFDVLIIDLLEEEYKHFKALSNLKIFIVSLTLFKFSKVNLFGNLVFYISLDEQENEDSTLKIFSGEDYFILSDNIINEKKKGEEIFKGEDGRINILLTMGGADPNNLTQFCIESLKLINDLNFHCTVVLGALNSRFEQLIKFYSRLERFEFLKHKTNVQQLYKNTDIAIINGGMTRYELIYFEIPYCCVSIHETQYKISQKATEKFGGINLGIYNQIKPEFVADQITNLIINKALRHDIKQKMHQNKFQYGKSNIYNEILNSYQQWRSFANNE